MNAAMSTPVLLGIVVACGLATYLMRVLPLWRRSRRQGSDSGEPAHASGGLIALATRFVQGIGAAAIAALLVASLWPGPAARAAGALGTWLPMAVGLAAVALLHRRPGGLAWPTLGGALAYGLVKLALAG